MYKVVNYVDCTSEQHREILALRNLDGIRMWMVNPEVISEVDHFRFVERLRDSPDRIYLAVYNKDMLVGTYNLSNTGNGVWERGIIANPLCQGKGETEKWERQILSGLSKRDIKAVSAKVKLVNQRSIKYHEKLGYQEIGRDNEYIYYIKNL